MKNYLTLLLSFFAFQAFAQPEITQANLPLVGDSVVISICSNPLEPGASGPMQTWDMAYLTTSEEQSFMYIPPSEGLMADSFPSANLCAKSWQDDYSYYNVSPTAFSTLGHVVTIDPNDTSALVFDNIEQFGLPYTYNDTYSDEFSGIFYSPGFGPLFFDGSLDFTADGYGTLILPNGTYTNVVRYHIYREQTSYFMGIPSTTSKDQWAWVSADYRFWLLLMEEIWDGFSTTSLIWYDKNPYPKIPTGINLPSVASGQISPNPVRTGEKIMIHWTKDEPSSVSFIRIDGSLIYKKQMHLTPGSNLIDCPEMAAGLYILRILTETGFSTEKVLVLNQ